MIKANQINNLGYCCINNSLKDFKQVNRGMIKATFKVKGINYCAELIKQNLTDLYSIVNWNLENGIFNYRMSSDMFPWMSEYKIKDLPDIQEISQLCYKIGDFAKKNNIRLSFHPSHFNVIASLNQNVINKSIIELNQHAEIMDLMGLPENFNSPINIHVNTVQGGKQAAAKRFCQNFKLLNQNCQKRLTVENDDFKNQFTPQELFVFIYIKIKIPICFDYFHYRLNPFRNQTEYTALKLCFGTWGEYKPLFHYSSSKQQETGDISIKSNAHSDYILEKINFYDLSFDLDLEAKAKDWAVQKYRGY